MTRPRIVHVYKDVYPPVEGGIERTIHHLARLTRGEFEPSVVCAARRRVGGRRTIDGDIEVVEVPCYGRPLSNPIAPGFIGALRASRADLFHFHLPHPTGEVAYLMSRLSTPAVATYHSDIVRQRAALLLYRPLLRRFLLRMTAIMPTSRRYLETSATLAPHAERCRVVPLGLPLEDYAETEETARLSREHRARWGDYVFFIGCLRAYKGLPFLIEAMWALEGVQLVIAGEGREAERLRRQARIVGLSERVHFTGRVDRASAVGLLRGAAVFCLPANQRSEAFGLCQIEAMTCGLPVVSTDLPTGVPEINRDGETGIIAPPGDAKGLTEALGRLLGDAALRRRMGEAGRRRAAEHYTAERMAREVVEVYREALARGGSTSAVSGVSTVD